ncbi:LpqB family beta-propeller domain-containing protein [Nocardioides sp. GXZ039]|uniref:LpqB family beta-propeller domain-containing protein n=1 Tax=Nocardioides sp. GXZ039 TaxID=3136018 RepID=UPI0030F43578
MSRARRLLSVTAVVLVVLLVSGCTSLPDSGPVVDADTDSQVSEREAAEVNAVPPTRGASAEDVVLGYFKAMTAWPSDTDTVKQFLSTDAARNWDPTAATITYAGQLLPRDESLSFSVPLNDPEKIDRNGSWAGRLPPGRDELELDLTIEDGQYRITNPPDALIVPDSWFSQRFRVASLYYFDPSGRILVPDPVFVPRGEQLTSTIITRLLAGPPADQQRVVRSFIPPGLRVEVSVPVSTTGVATVPLVGEAGSLAGDATEKMLAQLAWTLQQDPAISALRVTLDDEVLTGPSGEEEYQVSEAAPFDPSGYPATDKLFGVRAGALSTRDGNELVPVPGPFGSGSLALRAAAVSIDGLAAAGVTDAGRELAVGPIVESEDGVGPPIRPLRGTSLLQPVWDFAGRVWVVDRTRRGAVVHILSDNGRGQRLTVPGVSGRDVRSFLVSRDATRFVAVVRGPRGDHLRIGRIEIDDRGGLDRVAKTDPIVVQPGSAVRIRDIAWTSPTTIALLMPVDPGAIYEVRTVSVDGSPTTSEPLSTTLAEPVRGLAGSPMTDLPTYGVTDQGLINLTDGGSYGFLGDPASDIAYAG